MEGNADHCPLSTVSRLFEPVVPPFIHFLSRSQSSYASRDTSFDSHTFSKRRTDANIIQAELADQLQGNSRSVDQLRKEWVSASDKLEGIRAVEEDSRMMDAGYAIFTDTCYSFRMSGLKACVVNRHMLVKAQEVTLKTPTNEKGSQSWVEVSCTHCCRHHQIAGL